MDLCAIIFVAGCHLTGTSNLLHHGWGPRPLKTSFIENEFRLGLPLSVTPKSDDRFRSVFEIQVGVQMHLEGFRPRFDAVSGGFFLRF